MCNITVLAKGIASFHVHVDSELPISFQVGFPYLNGQQSTYGSLLRGILGAPSQNILKFRCLRIIFSAFSSQFWHLKNNQSYGYIYCFMFKDVHVKIFQLIEFFLISLQADNELTLRWTSIPSRGE